MAKPIPLFTVHMPASVDKPLLDVLHSGYIGQGAKVEEFEAALARFLGTRNVLTLNSGTSALTLALRLANVGPGDEVISTPMTCSATNTPIVAAGARIVWADIDPTTGLIDPLDVERKITPKTKAIMCVDWGGVPCDMDELMRIGEKYGVKVIEDAAHALGATYKRRMVGTVADFTCFSFQAIKHITTVDGGALTCRDSNAYRRGKLLRWYGIDRETDRKDMRCEEDIAEAGYKFHMNDVAAVIGLTVLPDLPGILARHRENAAYYAHKIMSRFYDHPGVPYDSEPSWWLYTLVLPRAELRPQFMDWMREQGIATSAVHSRNDTHTCFKDSRAILPGVDSFGSREVAIPVHHALSEKDRAYIADCCNEFASQNHL